MVMKLIAGLGNVGSRYDNTPHNVGFMVVDRLIEQMEEVDLVALSAKMKAEAWKGRIVGEDVLLVKPTTMMNLSGEAVQRVAQFYKITPEDIWIIHDELDLRLGRLKIGRGGSENGHNGLLSISGCLGHGRYVRFKMGVDEREGREIPGLAYVLMGYPESSGELLNRSVDMVVEAVKVCLKEGVEVGKGMYNKRVLE